MLGEIKQRNLNLQEKLGVKHKNTDMGFICKTKTENKKCFSCILQFYIDFNILYSYKFYSFFKNQSLLMRR